MAQTGAVQVSGRGTNVDFAIDDTSPFDEVVRDLRKYLKDNRNLWSKGNITVNAGSRIGSTEQLSEIKRLIENESGLTVARFWCSPHFLDFPSDSTAGPLSLQVRADPPRSPFPETPDGPDAMPSDESNAPLTEPPAVEPEHHSGLNEAGRSEMDSAVPSLGPSLLEELSQVLSEADDDAIDPRKDTALLVKTTCRSGEVIKHLGDVVILGDVNPGAEIVATGDITVFGALRGVAHAGSTGFTKAAIIALQLESPRLQIGPYVGLAPNAPAAYSRRRRARAGAPLIAFVKRRSIYVAKFAGRFARYSRGILYEG